MGWHKKHRKGAVATKVNRDNRVRRWLMHLDKLFIEIEMSKKDKS